MSDSTSFAALKRGRSQHLAVLQQEAKKIANPSSSYDDARMWKPEIDKAGNGYAVVRLLTKPKDESLDWVQFYSHGFKGPGGWFIENCPTSIKGQKCPVCDANSALWNSGIESDKVIARQRKRKLHYVSNVLVISDPKHPENEGKLFLWKFGKQIHDKIIEKLVPQFEGDQAFDPYCPWAGANLKIKIVKAKDFITFEKSEFDKPSALFDGDDEKIEQLWLSEYPLQPFLAPDQYKSYDALKERFDRAIGNTPAQTPAASRNTAPVQEAVSRPTAAATAPRAAAPTAVPAEPAPWDDDDSDSYFNEMTKEDNA